MSEKGLGSHEIRVSISEKRNSSPSYPKPFSFSGKFPKHTPPSSKPKLRSTPQGKEDNNNNDDDDTTSPPVPFHFRHPSMDLAKTRLIIIIWLGVLTLGVLFLFIFGTGCPTPPTPPSSPSLFPSNSGVAITPAKDTVIVPVVEKSNKNSVSFNLVDSLFTTVPLPDLNFDKLLRYDVCCYQQAYFICRSITKNLGVDCYLTKDKTAVVRLFHPDMTGARCTVIWSESS